MKTTNDTVQFAFVTEKLTFFMENQNLGFSVQIFGKIYGNSQ